MKTGFQRVDISITTIYMRINVNTTLTMSVAAFTHEHVSLN